MSVKRCANCDHPIYAHEPDGRELCREKGCPCPGYLTPSKGRPSLLSEAIEMVRFAHHEHAFEDTYCTPANCSVAEFLHNRAAEVSQEAKEQERG